MNCLLPRRRCVSLASSTTTFHLPSSRSSWANSGYKSGSMTIMLTRLAVIPRAPVVGRIFGHHARSPVIHGEILTVRVDHDRCALLGDSNQVVSQGFAAKNGSLKPPIRISADGVREFRQPLPAPLRAMPAIPRRTYTTPCTRRRAPFRSRSGFARFQPGLASNR